MNLRHGMTGTPTWHIYQGIKQRCSPKSGKNARWYKGIENEWATFEDFYADMGERPEGMTIERLDNQGNYCKANCRWASRAEQSRNTSQNRWLTFNGKTKCLSDWAEELGIKRTTLIMRLDSYGWSVERALSQKKLWSRQ